MKKRLAKLPSPAMAVAFVALLAALTGTAVALPGSNSVGIDDMRSNSVGKAELRTGSVGKAEILSRGVGAAEVINNSLRGTDINEGSLGTVPNANFARSAGFAGVAARAGSAAGTDSVRVSGFATASDGATDVLVVQGNGWRVELDCDLGGDGAILMLENTAAGNDASVTDDADYSDVDQGDEVQILDESTSDDPEGAAWSAIGASRYTAGQGHVINTPATGFGGADCVGASTLIG